MNDRYLYHAKRTDNGEWAEGLLTIMWGQFHIINPNDENTAYPIDPSTICQCTGLKDKNGKLIWENDICIINGFDDEDGCFVLEWEKSTARFAFDGDCCCVDFDNVYGYECEVVGNIFDNPELLEVEEEE